MLQTAYGSLTVGLDAQPGQTLLVRGGTSSVGLAAAVLAKDRGLTVLADHPPARAAPTRSRRSASTTRSSTTARWRRRCGRSGPTASTSRSSSSARRRCPTRCAPRGSTASSASPGCSATSGPCRDFYPIDYLPTGVRLTAYGGDAADLPAEVLQGSSTTSPPDALTVPLARTYELDEIATAHEDMEAGNDAGKLVVLP